MRKKVEEFLLKNEVFQNQLTKDSFNSLYQYLKKKVGKPLNVVVREKIYFNLCRIVNKQNNQQPDFYVLLNDFISVLLFEVFFAADEKPPDNSHQLQLQEEKQANCVKCADNASSLFNPLLNCQKCCVTQHAFCAGLNIVHYNNNHSVKFDLHNWTCLECTTTHHASHTATQPETGMFVICQMCPKIGGEYAPVANEEEQWVHLDCVKYIPQLRLEQGEVMGVNAIDTGLTICSLCGEDAGVCIPCNQTRCRQSFHVSCIVEYGVEIKTNLQKNATLCYCPLHSLRRFLNSTRNQSSDVSPSPYENDIDKENINKSCYHENYGNRNDGDLKAFGDSHSNLLAAYDRIDSDDLSRDFNETTTFCSVCNLKALCISSSSSKCLKCDSCGIIAHRECVGPLDMPSGAWSCDSCKFLSKKTPSRETNNKSVLTSPFSRSCEYPEFLKVIVPSISLLKDELIFQLTKSKQLLIKKINPVHFSFFRRIFASEELQVGDLLYSVNGHIIQNTTAEKFHQQILLGSRIIKSTCQNNVDIWFKTFNQKKLINNSKIQSTEIDIEPPRTILNSRHIKEKTKHQVSQPTPKIEIVESSCKNSDDLFQEKVKQVSSIDWPWFYIRSDGKIAMREFWSSTDFFFQPILKINNTCGLQKFSQILLDISSTVGFNVEKELIDLLAMPELGTPIDKHTDYGGDSNIFLTLNEKKNKEYIYEEIEVGETVNVMARTWPGMNKLGGVGRVKKVHKQQLFDIAYVLGGGEKMVERKYITKKNGLDKHEIENYSFIACFEFPQAILKVKTLPNFSADDGNRLLLFRLNFADKNPESILTDMARRNFTFQQENSLSWGNHSLSILDKNKVNHLFEDSISADDVFLKESTLHDEILDELKQKQEELRLLSKEIQLSVQNLRKKIAIELEKEQCDSESLVLKLQAKIRETDEANYHYFISLQNEAKEKLNIVEEGPDEEVSNSMVLAMEQSKNKQCAICLLYDGDLIPANTEKTKFAHVMCAMYTPETFLNRGENMVEGIDKISLERNRLTCCICKTSNKVSGAFKLNLIQCASGKCWLSFHIQCALMENLLTNYEHRFEVWCPKHLAKQTCFEAHHFEKRHFFPETPTATSIHPNASLLNSKDEKHQRQKNRKYQQRKNKSNDEVVRKERLAKSTTKKRFRKDSKKSEAREVNEQKKRKLFQIESYTVLSSTIQKISLIKTSKWKPEEKPNIPTIFKVGDTVSVASRTWPGVNKPGGVGRVLKVLEEGWSYNVKYVLGGVDKQIPGEYLSHMTI